jgi:hypothetical protein
MSDTVKQKTRQGAEDSAARQEFKWSATTRHGAISIVRTGQSSPVFIQQNT